MKLCLTFLSHVCNTSKRLSTLLAIILLSFRTVNSLFTTSMQNKNTTYVTTLFIAETNFHCNRIVMTFHMIENTIKARLSLIRAASCMVQKILCFLVKRLITVLTNTALSGSVRTVNRDGLQHRTLLIWYLHGRGHSVRNIS